MQPISNRYEFVVLFDVENGNPNGDPDANNAPRVDAETGLGIVTDVCLKRKIRNYVDLVKEGESGYEILVKTDKPLNAKFAAAHAQVSGGAPKGKDAGEIEAARKYICEHYYDVRTFGAVMSTGENPCGIVRGPVQINFARSLDPVLSQELTITRQAFTEESKFEKQAEKSGTMTEMGKKSVVPYALYCAEGYVSAMLAQKVTGFSEEDLSLLWEAIINMFEHDHSAARGKMCVRALYVFRHDSALGNAPSAQLFEKITVCKKDGVEYPRRYADYTVTVDEAMPAGVTLLRKL